MGKPVEVLTAEPAECPAAPGAGPAADLQAAFAGVLAEVVGAERVAAGSNFFADLGADSMVMARFCARVRKRPDLPPVSMKDVYRHPTIKSLAAALAGAAPAPAIEGGLAGVLAPASTLRSMSCAGRP